MSAPRKGRSERLGISRGVGAAKDWNPSGDDWRRFEHEAGLERGKKFNDEFRDEVRRAIGKYLVWEPFEHDAPTKGDVAERVAKAGKLAAELADLIDELGDAASLFDPQWRRHFSTEAPDSEGSSPVPADDDGALLELIRKEPLREYQRNFSGTLHAVQSVIDDTLMDATHSSGDGFEGGAAWARLVTDLATAFETVPGLKCTASKDSNRSLSPFVSFTKAVQSTLPPESRRHETDSGLSYAIWKVLKQKGNPQKREVNSGDGCRKSPPKRGKRAQIS